MERKKGYTILVVDDNPANLHLLSSLLKKQGYDVIRADGGQSGLAMAREHRPELILLDIYMPDLNGFEVCRKLKGDPSLESVPVLMVSGEHDVSAKVQCFELGAADYITKPYNQDEILARIKTHLRLRQLGMNLEESNNALIRKQHQLHLDIKAAAEIQKALLPQKFPDVNSVRFAYTFAPCERISGDLFNVQVLDEEHLGIYIMDISGHGVPAAMLTALVHQALLPQSGKVKQYYQRKPYYRLLSPAAVLDQLDNEFPIERFDRYFTMAYLLLNTSTGHFKYCCAGHPPILQVAADGNIKRHHQGGIMVGVGPLEQKREEGRGQLHKGDRLYLYTDGIIEYENDCGDPYGFERLEQLISAGRDEDLEILPAQLTVDQAAFSGGLAFRDDITLLVMEYCG